LADELPASAADYPELLAHLNRPRPRIAEGRALRGIASCAIDVSDGLLADLQHILDASGCGAEIFQQSLPFSPAARQLLDRFPEIWRKLISGGDDYQLCFCVAPENIAHLKQMAQQHDFDFTEIGRICAARELRCLDATGKVVDVKARGYSHFTEENQ